jgi:hypothetical protein
MYHNPHILDCSGKNTSANNGTYSTRNAQENAEKITTKSKTNPPHPYLRRYCHVLAARIAGEPPAFRGKPLICKKDTAHSLIQLYEKVGEKRCVCETCETGGGQEGAAQTPRREVDGAGGEKLENKRKKETKHNFPRKDTSPALMCDSELQTCVSRVTLPTSQN